MSTPSPTRFSPVTRIGYLEMVLRNRIDRARASRAAGDRGASVLEWVIISALVLALALAVGVILTRALTDRANDVETDIGGI